MKKNADKYPITKGQQNVAKDMPYCDNTCQKEKTKPAKK
ncbi:hypothetical protein Ga0466249_003256 [Sporomusaceae bacterium BoRhaA]|nr:hypothetical protein [Pelorhabdus rhamnosifermentans]